MLTATNAPMIKIIVSMLVFELALEPNFYNFHFKPLFYSCITIRKHFRAKMKKVKNKGIASAINDKSPEKVINRSILVGRKGLYMVFPS
jgi:hypothetical protein